MTEETDKTEEYWDNRTIEYKDDLDKMVWCSKMIHKHYRWFERLMDIYKDQTILDVGCGYGRIAPIFEKEKYHGIDFSQNLIDLARQKNPEYLFEKADAYEYNPTKSYGVVLAFHLSNLPMREKDFIQRYHMFAREAIIIVYADRITVINPKL